jgi:hypothetical protein
MQTNPLFTNNPPIKILQTQQQGEDWILAYVNGGLHGLGKLPDWLIEAVEKHQKDN